MKSDTDAGLRQSREVADALRGVLGPGGAFIVFFQGPDGRIVEASQNSGPKMRRILGQHLLGIDELEETGRERHVTPVS